MRRRYFEELDNLGRIEDIARQRNQIELIKAGEPTEAQAVVKTLNNLGNSILNYNRGKQRDLQEKQEKMMQYNIEQDRAKQQMVLKGYREYTPDEQYTAYQKTNQPVFSRDEFMALSPQSRETILSNLNAAPRTIDLAGSRWIEPDAGQKAGSYQFIPGVSGEILKGNRQTGTIAPALLEGTGEPAKGRISGEKSYAKQLKVINGEWVIFDPLSGTYKKTGEKASNADKKKPPQLKTVKNLAGQTTFFMFDPNTGTLVETTPGVTPTSTGKSTPDEVE